MKGIEQYLPDLQLYTLMEQKDLDESSYSIYYIKMKGIEQHLPDLQL